MSFRMSQGMRKRDRFSWEPLHRTDRESIKLHNTSSFGNLQLKRTEAMRQSSGAGMRKHMEQKKCR